MDNKYYLYETLNEGCWKNFEILKPGALGENRCFFGRGLGKKGKR